jgi:CBS domain containing-hemolysin-like protein
LARFEHYYAYFLLFVTVLPAIMRLAMPQRVAVLTSERMAAAKTRSRYFKIGLISAVVSILAAILYAILWRQQAWLVLAAAIGLLSGVEMVGNTRSFEPSSLKSQNLVFGALYAVAAVATWLVLLR